MLKNLKIREKLIGGFLIMGCVILFVGAIGWYGAHTITKYVGDIGDVRLPSVQSLLEMQNGMKSAWIGERGLNIRGIWEKSEVLNAQFAYIDKAFAAIDTNWQVYEPLPQTAEEAVEWKKFVDAYANWKSEYAKVINMANQKKQLLASGYELRDSRIETLSAQMFEQSLQSRAAYNIAEGLLNTIVKINIDIAAASNAAAHTASSNAMNVIVATGLIGVILALVFGILIARSITMPINQVVALIKDIAEGEGDLTKRLPADSKDEIGEMSKWFNTFVEKLHDIIARVASSAIQIATATQELASTAEEMASGAEEQTAQTAQVATSAEEMSATIQEVAKNSATAAGKAKESGDTATKGGSVVNETITGINKIANAVKDLQQVVGGLSRNSEKIGNIVGVIDDVADQTNLLALNAAIEAARAGEQGRGFAVVADEVRKLAERTTASTKEISLMVKTIQDDTGKAVTSMETSAKEVEGGVILAGKAGDSLREILNSSKMVQDLVQQIATSAEEQSSAAEQISSNVESIASVSKQSANAAQQTSTASQEISQLTEELQNIVRKFKLSDSGAQHQAAEKKSHRAPDAHFTPSFGSAPAHTFEGLKKNAPAAHRSASKGDSDKSSSANA